MGYSYNKLLPFIITLSISVLSACHDNHSSSGENAKLNKPTPNYQAMVLDTNFTGITQLPANNEYIIWGSDGTIQLSADGVTWRQATVPITDEAVSIDKAITHIEVNYDGEKTTLVAIGEAGTLLYSVDSGNNWIKADVAPLEENINDVIYHAKTKAWLAVGDKGLLLRSTDNAVHWQAEKTGMEQSILALSILKDGNTILAGADAGLLAISKNGGSEWSLFNGETETPITNFYEFGSLTIATSAWGRMFLSHNLEDWQLLQAPSSMYFNSAIQDPVYNTIVLTGHNGDVLLSPDEGKTWQVVDIKVADRKYYLGDLFYDLASKSLLAFGHHGIVVASSDGGYTWQQLQTGLGNTFRKAVFNPARGDYLTVGDRGFKALYHTKNQQWQPVTSGKDYYWRQVVETPSGAMLVAGELGKILHSDDAGASWDYLTVAYPSLNTPPTYHALVNDSQAKAVIAAGPTGLILRATEDGKQWRITHYTPFDSGEAFTHVALDNKTGLLLAIEAFSGFYLSTDKGVTWLPHKIDDERNFWHASLLNSKGSTLGILSGQSGLAVSVSITDNGRTVDWQPLSLESEEDLFGTYASETHQALYVFGQKGRMWRAQANAMQWSEVTTQTTSALRRMIEEPKQRNLVAFGEDGTITVSADGGQNWVAASSGVKSELRAAVIEPGTGNIIVVGRDGVLLRSRNAGIDWERLDSHTHSHLRDLAVHQQTGAIIAVGEKIVRLQPVQ